MRQANIPDKFLSRQDVLHEGPVPEELTLEELSGIQNQKQNQKLKITSIGREVLKGEKNWLEIVEIDRWIGGVHLTKNTLWCWNSKAGVLIKKS